VAVVEGFEGGGVAGVELGDEVEVGVVWHEGKRSVGGKDVKWGSG
jgi:hypothetical protein